MQQRGVLDVFLRLQLALPSVHPLPSPLFPLFAFLVSHSSAALLLSLAAGESSHMCVHFAGVGIAGALEAGLGAVPRLTPRRWCGTSQPLAGSRGRLDAGLLRVAGRQISQAPEPFKTCGGLWI